MTINAQKVISALQSTFHFEMSVVRSEFGYNLIEAGEVSRIGEYFINIDVNNYESTSILHKMILDGAAPHCAVTLSREEFIDVFSYGIDDIMNHINDQDHFKRRNIQVLSYSFDKSSLELIIKIKKEYSIF